MTIRERRIARAEHLREWADKRESSARATLAADDAAPYAHDIAFLTQPGRIPERTRMNARADRAYASLAQASSMAARADGIERAAERAIYSDDPDAIVRLEERIDGLTVMLEARKELNAKYRRDFRTELAAMTPYQRSQSVPFPSYAITNVSGNIARLRVRLAALRRAAAG